MASAIPRIWPQHRVENSAPRTEDFNFKSGNRIIRVGSGQVQVENIWQKIFVVSLSNLFKFRTSQRYLTNMHCWFVWSVPGTSAPLVKFVKMSRNFLLEFVSWNYYWSLPKINTRATTQARPSTTIQILHSHYYTVRLQYGGDKTAGQNIFYSNKTFQPFFQPFFPALLNFQLCTYYSYLWLTSAQSFAVD